MANCNRKLLKVNVFPDLWSSTKKPTDYNICSDIWFVAKNVDDIELFTEFHPFTINKPISDIDIISDNVGLTYQKPFTDYLSAPIDIDVIFFTKNNSDTEIFSELKYFAVTKILSSYNELIDNLYINYSRNIDSYQNIEDYNFKYTNKPLIDDLIFSDDNNYSLNRLVDNIENIEDSTQLLTTKSQNDFNLSFEDDNNKQIIKSIFYGGYYFPNYYFNSFYAGDDYLDTSEAYTSGNYFEELYAGSDYIESNGIFITEYIQIINYYIWMELFTVIDNLNLNMNKYTIDNTNTTDTSLLYNNTYLDANYFEGMFVGNYVKILH